MIGSCPPAEIPSWSVAAAALAMNRAAAARARSCSPAGVAPRWRRPRGPSDTPGPTDPGLGPPCPGHRADGPVPQAPQPLACNALATSPSTPGPPVESFLQRQSLGVWTAASLRRPRLLPRRRMAWRVPRKRGYTSGRPTPRAQRRRARGCSARGKNDRGWRVREAAERELLETLSEDAIEPLAVVVERATEAGVATEVLTPALGQVQRRVARRAAEDVLIASS